MNARAAALGIFVMSLVTFAWFAPQDAGNSQVVTRVGLTLSLVENGRLDIDRFAPFTIDKAAIGEHFYADKVPGLSLLAVPSVAAARVLLALAGDNINTDDPAVRRQFAWVATVFTNGLFSALAAALLFLSALRLGARPGGAAFASVALALGTPFLGWSSTFFAHAMDGSLLLIAGSIAIFGFTGRQRPLGLNTFWFGAVLGLIFGFAAVVELTAAPLLAVAGLAVLIIAARSGRLSWPTLFGGMIVGGLVGGLPLLIYNQLAFGSPFKLGYSSVVGFEGMNQGFFGITMPKVDVVVQILFGLYRGIVPLAPVLLLVPVGLWAMWKAPATRAAAILILITFLSYLLINSGYFYWDGGWSTGPRHIVATLPALSMALAFAWPQQTLGKVVASVLLAISCVISAIAAATDMFAPSDYSVPLTQYLLPKLFEGSNLVHAAPIVFVWLLAAVLLRRLDDTPETGLRVAGDPRVAAVRL